MRASIVPEPIAPILIAEFDVRVSAGDRRFSSAPSSVKRDVIRADQPMPLVDDVGSASDVDRVPVVNA